jgi:probable F420-dependent oxidoreductase
MIEAMNGPPPITTTTPRPFRFAVQAMKAESAREWRTTAREVEDLGYSTLFVADHYLGPGPVYDRSGHLPQNLAPIAAIATAAGATEHLRVGCRVFAVDFHVPAVLASETATLDLLSDGRLEVGIGAGYLQDEYEAMGLVYETGKRRVDKLVEAVALLKAHWSGEQMDLTGDHVNVSGYAGLPAPVQRPHPPLMIGGSRRRLLTLAGREADIASFNHVPFDRTDDGLTPEEELLRRVRYVREAAGERFPRIELETSPYWAVVTNDARGAVDRLAASLQMPPERLHYHPNVLIGSVDTVAERLTQWRELTGISYVTITRSNMGAFAHVVDRLSGR